MAAESKPRTYIPIRRQRSWRARLVSLAVVVALAFVAIEWRSGALGNAVWFQHLVGPFSQHTEGGIAAALYEPGGLRVGQNRLAIEFRDAATHAPLAVSHVQLELDLTQPGSIVHITAILKPSAGKTGRYETILQLDEAGVWTALLHFTRPGGNGLMAFPLEVKAN